jgi:hypothetical protein
MRNLAVLVTVLALVIVGCAVTDVSASNDQVFSGRVSSSFGKPIEGAEVSAFVRDGRSLQSALKPAGSAVTSDKTGVFRMSDLSPSMVYTIVIRAHGYERQKWNVFGSRYLGLRLRPATGSISGHVVDRDGKPVQGVWVKVGLGIDSLYTCRSGGDGGFSFSDLIPDAMITVCVGGDNYTKSARVGGKDITVMVDPDKVKDFKPVFPDHSLSNSILDILKHKLTNH